MTTYELSRVGCTIWIAASPRSVFEAWAKADELARWFQHAATNRCGPESNAATVSVATTGTHYEWRMVHGHLSRGRFLMVEPDRLLRLTFGATGDMSFAVHLEPHGSGTLVHLVHENIPPQDIEAHVDIRAGWTFFLTNLKAWLEHGVDLREISVERIRAGVLNV